MLPATPHTPKPPGGSSAEGEAERQTARVFKASQKLASAVNEQEEVHRKKVQAAEALQAALAERPPSAHATGVAVDADAATVGAAGDLATGPVRCEGAASMWRRRAPPPSPPR